LYNTIVILPLYMFYSLCLCCCCCCCYYRWHHFR